MSKTKKSRKQAESSEDSDDSSTSEESSPESSSEDRSHSRKHKKKSRKVKKRKLKKKSTQSDDDDSKEDLHSKRPKKSDKHKKKRKRRHSDSDVQIEEHDKVLYISSGAEGEDDRQMHYQRNKRLSELKMLRGMDEERNFRSKWDSPGDERDKLRSANYPVNKYNRENYSAREDNSTVPTDRYGRRSENMGPEFRRNDRYEEEGGNRRMEPARRYEDEQHDRHDRRYEARRHSTEMIDYHLERDRGHESGRERHEFNNRSFNDRQGERHNPFGSRDFNERRRDERVESDGRKEGGGRVTRNPFDRKISEINPDDVRRDELPRRDENRRGELTRRDELPRRGEFPKRDEYPRRDEIPRRDEHRRIEPRREEYRRDEPRREDLRRDEPRREDLRRDEFRRDELRRDEPRRDERGRIPERAFKREREESGGNRFEDSRRQKKSSDRRSTERESHNVSENRRNDKRDGRKDFDRESFQQRKGSHERRRPRSSSQSPGPPKNRRFRRDSNEDAGNHEWGKKSSNSNDNSKQKGPPVEKEKPNFGLSGKLTEDANKVNGVVINYAEPPEARKPKRRWRLYPFKGTQSLQTFYIHRQSCFLIGRDRKICDIPIDHPSCSKQHAVLQYRLVPYEKEDGSTSKRVRPYILDMNSANGTFVNNNKIESKKYVELLEKDVIKFGYSSREYVLLHENSKDDNLDDDIGNDEMHIKTEGD